MSRHSASTRHGAHAGAVGLKTIGALVDMPRLALARRFKGEEDVVLALDGCSGARTSR